jgi:hypothetical protein
MKKLTRLFASLLLLCALAAPAAAQDYAACYITSTGKITACPGNVRLKAGQTLGAAYLPTIPIGNIVGALAAGGNPITGTILTATTRVDAPSIGTDAANQHAPPSGTGALVSTDATQTLTNKTIGASQLSGQVAVANGGTGAASLTAHGVVVGNGTSPVSVTGAGTAGQVLTSNGPSADPTFQAPVTATQGSAYLSSTPFNVTSTSGEDIGLSISLPSAGTYLVQAELRQAVAVSASPSGFIASRFRNTTDSTDIANSERLGIVAPTTGVGYTGTTIMTEVITVAASKTIAVFSLRGAGPTYTTSQILSDTSGRSRIGYVKLSP